MIKNSRAVTPVISTILILSIVLIIVALTYVWGADLIQKQGDHTHMNYAKAKLLQLNTNIEVVVHEGANSSRALRLDTGDGRLYVINGTPCDSLLLPSRNGVVYELFTDDELISTEPSSWFIIDPRENSIQCEDVYGNHSAGVILARANSNQSQYKNEIMLWYRELNVSGGNKYLINITLGRSTLISGTSAIVTVTNRGTVFIPAEGVYYTNVEVNMQ